MWKIKVFLPNYTTLENAVICVIERLLSEYQAANKPKWEYGCTSKPKRAGAELKVSKSQGKQKKQLANCRALSNILRVRLKSLITSLWCNK